MKIISKYKDYYDYLKGIYGEDPLLILDRRTSTNYISYEELLNSTNPYLLQIKIGNYNYLALWYNKQLLYGDKLKPYLMDRVTAFPSIYKYNKSSDEMFLNLPELKRPFNYEFLTEVKSDSIINICYIDLIDYVNNRKFINNKYFKNIDYPNLSLLKGIGGLIEPHKAWLHITDYLSEQLTKKEPDQPVGDDIIRLQSAGFDKKTSFRNM